MIRWWAARLTAQLQRLRDPAAPWNRIAVAVELIDAWKGPVPTPSAVAEAKRQRERTDADDAARGVTVGAPTTVLPDEELLAAAVLEVQAAALWRRQPDRPLRAARLLAALGGDEGAAALVAALATDLPALRAEPAEAARRRALLVAAAARFGRGVLVPVLAQAVRLDAHVANLAAILDAACGRASARAMIEAALPAATIEQQAGYRRLLDALAG